MPRGAYGAMADGWDAVATLRRAGWRNLRLLRRARGGAEGELVTIHLPMLQHPVTIRTGTTDADELTYTAIRDAYGQVPPSGTVRFIVDAGANIGDSTSWYLSKYPKAKAVALEPDPENFSLLVRNCLSYGERALLLKAGLWSHDAHLQVSPTGAKDALTVREVPAETPGSCPGRSMLSLLAEAGATEIDILKCDIEGAERELFSHDADGWLAVTRNIYIELHGAAAEDAVFAATRRHGFRHVGYRNVHAFRK